MRKSNTDLMLKVQRLETDAIKNKQEIIELEKKKHKLEIEVERKCDIIQGKDRRISSLRQENNDKLGRIELLQQEQRLSEETRQQNIT